MTQRPVRGADPLGLYGARPSPEALAKARQAKRIRLVLACVFLFGGVAFAWGWNPPTKDLHHFSEASDYDSEKESGCTNSGEGCHGSEKEYTDFNVYHPNAKCTTCHEYQGVGCIPCHKPNQHDCALCHDGSMEGVGDRVRITDPYPRGHYRESTHTAMGTDMDGPVRAAEEGRAVATCRDCHARDLRKAHTGVRAVADSPYGDDIGCGECHNDVRSTGLAEVEAGWKKRSCDACHKVGTSSPMHGVKVADAVEATSPLACGDTGSGCHALNDLHALHSDVPTDCAGSAADGEGGCHDIEVQAHVPGARTCAGDAEGACHRAYVNDRYSHDKDADVHSPRSGTAAADRSFRGVPCGDCHLMAADGASLVSEHVRPTSSGSSSCRGCHNHDASADAIADDWADADSIDACSTCHGNDGLDTAHGRDLGPLHASASPGCADSGAGCHPTGDLLDVAEGSSAGLHSSCLRCHDPSASGGNLAYSPEDRTCGAARDCHAGAGDYDPKTAVHDGAGGRADGGDAAHHDAGGEQGDAVYADFLSGISTKCVLCHRMVLGVSHARMDDEPGEVCEACHNASAASAAAVKDDWPGKGTDEACEACHGTPGIDSPHLGITEAHAGAEAGPDGSPLEGYCARGGCHDSAELRVLHREGGCTIPGCHDGARPSKAGCGGGEAQGLMNCHVGYTEDEHLDITEVHEAAEYAPDGKADEGYCSGAGCHATVNARDLHGADGCAVAGCHDKGGPARLSCGGSDAQAGTNCHLGFGPGEHAHLAESHLATEYGHDGEPDEGYCVGSGCHASRDVRDLHERKGCATPGCHAEDGPERLGCGGLGSQGTINCHLGYTSTSHVGGGVPADHSADCTGTVDGVEYGYGANVGCFGCHAPDLRSEHSSALAEGSMEGDAATTCGICHADVEGAGRYAGLPAVKDAIERADKRCIACHASGGPRDGANAVASPHKKSSAESPLPAGAVWADPFEEWRTAFDSKAGGGHNSLSSAVVGASGPKSFPSISYSPDASTTYTWALPVNGSTTLWLGGVEYDAASLQTTEAIRAMRVGCDDCHAMPEDPAGPQGAAVRVGIDPAYSQTEYADPTRGLESQFDTTGTDRVVCFKCHNIAAGSVPGSADPGGHRVHSAHAEHEGFPDYNPVRYGEKCVDCHVRIPHAWKGPRLLVRTVVTSDGVEPDEFPYVRAGHDGLRGILLRDFETAGDLRSRSCVNGGCHGRHSSQGHPMPSDVPSAAYWP